MCVVYGVHVFKSRKHQLCSKEGWRIREEDLSRPGGPARLEGSSCKRGKGSRNPDRV